MKKVKLTQEQLDSAVNLVPNGLIAQDKTIQQAVEYVDSMHDFNAQLAFYILWNAIGKDYLLIRKDEVQLIQE